MARHRQPRHGPAARGHRRGHPYLRIRVQRAGQLDDGHLARWCPPHLDLQHEEPARLADAAGTRHGDLRLRCRRQPGGSDGCEEPDDRLHVRREQPLEAGDSPGVPPGVLGLDHLRRGEQPPDRVERVRQHDVRLRCRQPPDAARRCRRRPHVRLDLHARRQRQRRRRAVSVEQPRAICVRFREPDLRGFGYRPRPDVCQHDYLSPGGRADGLHVGRRRRAQHQLRRAAAAGPNQRDWRGQPARADV